MFGRIIGIGGVVASFVAGGMTSASAQSNVALVIGNSHYLHAMPLPTTAADAAAIAETLRNAGYDVTPANDVRQSDFSLLLRIFLGKFAGGSNATGFFYYTGYAAQSDGQNYLVPVDAAITGAGDVAGQWLGLGELVDAFAGTPAGARIVVLDASYAHGFGRGGAQPVPPGLAPMSAPAGMIVALAAGPGEVAGAATGNSLFTHMVSRLAELPGLDLDRVSRSSAGADQATNGSQTPWMTSALTTDVKLFALPQPAAPAPPPAAATAPAPAHAVATAPAPQPEEAIQPTKKEKQRAAERSRPRKAARTSPAESAPDAPPPPIPLSIGIGGIGVGIGGGGIGIGIGH